MVGVSTPKSMGTQSEAEDSKRKTEGGIEEDFYEFLHKNGRRKEIGEEELFRYRYVVNDNECMERRLCVV